MNSETTVKPGRSEEPIRNLTLARQVTEAHELDVESRRSIGVRELFSRS